MEPISVIAGLVGLFGTLMSITKSVKDSENANQVSQDTKDLAQKNLALNEKTAQQNYDLSVQQFNYQKELNQLQMNREDTAFQRQVKDLQAAGLSPLMVAGNGASSSPLTSASAPQFDTTGINQAMQNMIGAYNDSYTRKLQSTQFSLQSKVQTAQAYTQLAELALQKKQADLEYKYLNSKYQWEEKHGYRDLSSTSELINLLETILGYNKNSTIKLPGDTTLEDVKESVSDAINKDIEGNPSNFATYGAIPQTRRYAHTLDNDNYNNNRSTFNLLKEESKEKFAKLALLRKDTENNRTKLYNTDDYLKKHISLDNWIKSSNEFIKYYLKNGQFEGHKKYFD